MTTASSEAWPELDAEAWRPTREHLHLMTQVLGKLRLAQAEPVNHWWHVTLQVSECGLTTGAVPWKGEHFEARLDLLRERLRLSTSRGEERELPLGPGTVAGFHRGVMDALDGLGMPVAIGTAPQEMEHKVPFDQDDAPRPFDGGAARRFHRALRQADRLMRVFRGRFLGKSSPVHFFWGSFDHAVTRFSGRHAPARPDADAVTREAYSHEVSSAGFWPGGQGNEALFYCYASPAPEGFEQASAGPPGARYDQALGEFVLPYAAARAAPDPDAAVLRFLQATYEAAADGAGWDRAALERGP